MSNDNNNNKNTFLYKRYRKTFLPYLPNLYEKISLILKNYNILTVPRNKNNTSNNIVTKGKDKNAKTENTNTVYKMNCKNCSASYVGESKRMVGTRINEHKNSKVNVNTTLNGADFLYLTGKQT